MKRDSEMEMLKLAEHERLAQEQNVLEREKMAQDHDIRQETLAVSRDVNAAHAEYYRAGAKAYREGTKTGTQRAIKQQEQERALMAEINEHATELNLDDVNFQTKQPVQFAANVLQFDDAWKASPHRWVQSSLKKLWATANQQKVELKEIDEQGAAFGDPKPVPYWQVVKNLKDPETKERMMLRLRANKQLKEEVVPAVPGTPTKDWSRPIDTAWDAIIGPANKEEEKVVKDKMSPELDRINKQSEGVEFKRVPSRVPPVAAPKSAYDTLPEPEPMPDGFSQPQTSANPKFEETETDKYIRMAKAAIAKRPEATMAVAQRLQEWGVDPQALWS